MLGLGWTIFQVSTYVTAGSIYTESTITVLLTLLMILAISMQIARRYFLRVLKKFTLRLAADIWWLLFILLRDASIFLIVFLGFMLFYPGTYQDYPISVPFMPLAIDFFAFALVILLVKDTDEDPKWNRILTLLVGAGSLLYIFGTITVTESAAQLTRLPPTVSLSTSNIWGFFFAYFNSQANPALSIYSFYFCLALLMVAGGIAFMYGIQGDEPRGSIKTEPKPIIKTTQQPSGPQPQATKPNA